MDIVIETAPRNIWHVRCDKSEVYVPETVTNPGYPPPGWIAIQSSRELTIALGSGVVVRRVRHGPPPESLPGDESGKKPPGGLGAKPPRRKWLWSWLRWNR